jgi:phosphohistidine phosphatase SixA
MSTSPRPFPLAAFAFALGAALSSLASPSVARAQAPARSFPLEPAVDAGQALSGRELLEALRRGGFVIFLRHADQGALPQVEDCSVTMLTPEGLAQATKLGETIRRAGIPADPPLTSPLCRALQTARHLGLGTPVPEPGLIPDADRDKVEARDRLLSTPPRPGRNTLLVGHITSAPEGKKLMTDKASLIVFRPDGAGGRAVVAHVLPDAWATWAQERPAGR